MNREEKGDKTLAHKDVRLLHFAIIVVSTALSAASFVFTLPPEDPLKPVSSTAAKNPVQLTARTIPNQFKSTSQMKSDKNSRPKRKFVSKIFKKRSFRPVLVKKIKAKIVAGNSPNSVLVYNSSRSRQNGL